MKKLLVITVSLILCARTVALAVGLPNGSWSSVGPATIDGWWGAGAGRVNAIVVGDEGEIVIGAANGGLWRRGSPSDSDPWSPVGDRLPSLSFGALDHFGSTYYAASGEGNYNCGDCNIGKGIFQSTDRGVTWHPFTNSPVKYATAIRVSPIDGRTLWLAGDKGVFVYQDGKWTQENISVTPPFDRPTSIAIDPRTPNRVFVADSSGIVEQTQPEGAWTRLNVPIAPKNLQINPSLRFSGLVALAPSNPDIMYSSFAYAAWNGGYNPGCLAGFFQSSDGGQHWNQMYGVPDYFEYYWSAWNIRNSTAATCQGSYDSALAVDPTNSSVVYVGGITLLRLTCNNLCSWSRIGNMLNVGDSRPRDLHPDQHIITFAKDGTAYVGNDGGVLQVAPGGGAVKPLSPGLAIAQFYQRGSVSNDGTIMLGGTQDNGSIRLAGIVFPLTSSTEWHTVFGGDGAYTAISAAHPNEEYVEDHLNDMESTENGDQDNPKFDKIGPPAKTVGFYMPFIVDAMDWKTIYAGADAIYKTINGGVPPSTTDNRSDPSQAWEKIASWGSPCVYPYKCVVTAFDVANNGQTILAGRDDYVLMISTMGGQPNTWTTISGMQGAVMSVAINPADPSEAYVATKYEDRSQLFHITGLQPQLIPTPKVYDIRGAALPPVDSVRFISGQVVLGTDDGVWALSPDQHSWARVGQNNTLPAVPVRDVVQMSDGTLIALTHGRGAWILRP